MLITAVPASVVGAAVLFVACHFLPTVGIFGVRGQASRLRRTAAGVKSRIERSIPSAAPCLPGTTAPWRRICRRPSVLAAGMRLSAATHRDACPPWQAKRPKKSQGD